MSRTQNVLLFLVLGILAVSAQVNLYCNKTDTVGRGKKDVAKGFCVSAWASRLSTPRGLRTASNGDVLVIERGKSSITVLWDDNKDGVSGPHERATLARLSGLNHGLAIDEERNFVYASTSREVFRWPYRAGLRSDLGQGVKVVKNVPCCHHTTRSLLIRPSDGALFVTVGSASNLDENDLHARIHLFTLRDINENIPNGGVVWEDGAVFARGLRNEVGINYDAQGRIWGVENGVDNLQRPDLGPNLVFNNPGEEVNLFLDQPQLYDRFYGYPFCWSELFLPPETARGPGTQWAHPHFMNTGRPEGTDQWCQNPNNVIRPSYQLPPHSAPLDILFYYGSKFPQEYVGDAFVALHGSWNRADPVGYAVVRLHFEDGMPVRHSIVLANGEKRSAGNSPAYPMPADWYHRPVGLGIGPCGIDDECLYVSSDASNTILVLAYEG